MAISGAESLDPRLAEALRVEGGAEAVRSAVAALGGDCGEEQGEALGCLAMKAAQYGALDVAAGLAVRAGTSSRSGARTRANLTEQMLRVASLGTASEVLSREGVSVRVGAVRAVDKTLRAARREDDAELIEDIVALLFNIARPLLQPELVGLVAVSLEAAATALEEVGSLRSELRASLHLELARKEDAAGRAEAAALHVDKALALDVPLDECGQSRLDAPLLRLKRRLALRLDIYSGAPESPTDRALVLLDRARGAASAVKAQLCTQVQELLAEAEPGQESDAPGDSQLKRERTLLWAELMKAAWQERLRPVARASAERVLAIPLETEPLVEVEVARRQAEARLVLAETFVAEAEELAAAPDDGGTGAAVMRQESLREIEAGIELGLALRDDDIVYNGCVCLWNYNEALLLAETLEPLRSSLRVAARAMAATDQAVLARDTPLVELACAVAATFARAVEAGIVACKDGGPEDGLKEDTDRALEACTWADGVATGRPQLKRELTAAWARLQAHAGSKQPTVGAEPESQARANLELLRAGLVDGASAKGLLASAKQLLGSDESPRPAPELWMRAAEQSLRLDDVAGAVRDCERALAPLTEAAGDPDGTHLKRSEWRWFAMAEVVHGEAIGRLLSPSQPAALQIQLHAKAAERLAMAMERAAQGGETGLILAAASRIWSHCAPFAESAGTELALITEPVSRALAAIGQVPAAERAAAERVIVRLYELRLAKLAEESAWERGAELLREAFAMLPKPAHPPLWEYKVRFLCRAGGGRELAAEMLKVKQLPPTEQARLWTIVGSEAQSEGERLQAMIRASEVVADRPQERVNRLVALGEWLFASGISATDAEDQLLAAVDLLLVENESSAGDADREGDTDATDDDDAAFSTVSTARTRIASEVVGAATSVRQCEQLARIYLVLARLTASAADRTERCLVAHHYMRQMWAVSAAAATALEAAPPDGVPPLPDGEVLEPFGVPSEPHDWLGWQPPARMVQLMAAADSEMVLGVSSLPMPELTAAHLWWSVDTFNEAGMTLHSLLPLSLLRHMAATVVQRPAFESLTILRTAHLLRELGASDAAAEAMHRAASWRPTAEQKRDSARRLEDARRKAPARRHPPPEAVSAANPLVHRPQSQPRSATRTDAALRVDLAAALLVEGEWSAAGEWLDQARPMLEALGDDLGRARCLATLAQLHALRGDAEEALRLQAAALRAAPLEVDEWASAVLSLSSLQAKGGAAAAAEATLREAAQICETAKASPSSKAEAIASQARLCVALGRLHLSATVGASEAPAKADEHFKAATLLLQPSGASLALIDALSARVDAVERGGASAADADKGAVEDDVAGDADILREEKALGEMMALLAAAVGHAERLLYRAAPRSAPPSVSLPTARTLAQLRSRQARVELRLAELQERRALRLQETAPRFPRVQGRDEAAVLDFVRGNALEARRDAGLCHVERALVHSSSSLALAGHSRAALDAGLSLGRALIAMARGRGHGGGVWKPKAPKESDGEEAKGEAGRDAGSAEAEVEAEAAAAGEAPGEGEVAAVEDGAEEAREGEAGLLRLVEGALKEGDAATAREAALALADAAGAERPLECGRWLSVATSCAARLHWLAVWRRACDPRSRFAVLLSQLSHSLEQRWAQPAQTPVWKSAQLALDDAERGCVPWRSLEVETGSLRELLAGLPAGARVVQLTTTTHGRAYGMATIAQAGDGDPPVLVSRAELSPAALSAAIDAINEARRLHRIAALNKSKSDLLPAAVAEEMQPAAPPEPPEPPEPAAGPLDKLRRKAREVARAGRGAAAFQATPPRVLALRDAVSKAEALLAPLLEPLVPMLETPAGSLETESEPQGGTAAVARPPTIVIVDPCLSPLPLELLGVFAEECGGGGVCRDLSVSMLRRRLALGAPDAPRGAVRCAVDVHDEVRLPTGVEGGRLGEVFASDVLDSEALAHAAEWPALLGSRQAPSATELAHALAAGGSFLYHGPGSLLSAALTPQQLAPLDLRACAGCLLFDAQESSLSSRRIAREANAKDAARLALEEPHATAALLSLGGVRTVVLHHWAAAPAERHAALTALLGQLGEGKTAGEAVRARHELQQPEESPPPGGGANPDVERPPSSLLLYGLPHYRMV
uniref:Uncharacterized protein n=1 Tax=Emiliania huxleyi TaxID=2903 RepID=A0A7S3U006_EMIHU